jgi:hypothetical protein
VSRSVLNFSVLIVLTFQVFLKKNHIGLAVQQLLEASERVQSWTVRIELRNGCVVNLLWRSNKLADSRVILVSFL